MYTLQNQPMMDLYNSQGDQSMSSPEQKHDLSSVHMGAKPDGMFASLANSGGPGKPPGGPPPGGPNQQKGLDYEGFMRKLLRLYDPLTQQQRRLQF